MPDASVARAMLTTDLRLLDALDVQIDAAAGSWPG